MHEKGRKTRNHILEESRRLFTSRGFQNTSVSEIIAATGVKKGNLYYYFPSKEELGLAVLTDAADEFYGILQESLTGKNPVLRILNSCDAIMHLMQQSNFVGGCLFGNTALEMSGSNPRYGNILQQVFSRWSERLEQELREAEGMGLLSSPVPAGALAVSIVAILEGGIMLSRVYEDKKALQDCIITIASLIGAE